MSSPQIIIVNASSPQPPVQPPIPEKRNGPSAWTVFAVSITVFALTVVIALVIVALTGDPVKAHAIGAFIRALMN